MYVSLQNGRTRVTVANWCFQLDSMLSVQKTVAPIFPRFGLQRYHKGWRHHAQVTPPHSLAQRTANQFVGRFPGVCTRDRYPVPLPLLWRYCKLINFMATWTAVHSLFSFSDFSLHVLALLLSPFPSPSPPEGRPLHPLPAPTWRCPRPCWDFCMQTRCSVGYQLGMPKQRSMCAELLSSQCAEIWSYRRAELFSWKVGRSLLLDVCVLVWVSLPALKRGRVLWRAVSCCDSGSWNANDSGSCEVLMTVLAETSLCVSVRE